MSLFFVEREFIVDVIKQNHLKSFPEKIENEAAGFLNNLLS